MGDDGPPSEEWLAELLALLPPAPEGWVRTAQERPFGWSFSELAVAPRELADVEAHELRPPAEHEPDDQP